MSFGIERQSDQYGAFVDDPGVYASRDRVAIYDVPDGVPEYLASARPGITAGLLNPRQAWAREDMSGHGHYDPEEEARQEEGDVFADQYGHAPHEDPYAGHNPHHVPVQPLDQFLDSRTGPPAPEPPSFSVARRLTADDGPDSALFTPALYSPEKRLDAESGLFGGEPDRWVTALAVPPAQPAPPAAPVWLGHTYAPGHRVGLPWRDQTLPGTVTHLEGYNVGVRWDDGQHSVEEASAIQPLHQWS